MYVSPQGWHSDIAGRYVRDLRVFVIGVAWCVCALCDGLRSSTTRLSAAVHVPLFRYVSSFFYVPALILASFLYYDNN